MKVKKSKMKWYCEKKMNGGKEWNQIKIDQNINSEWMTIFCWNQKLILNWNKIEITKIGVKCVQSKWNSKQWKEKNEIEKNISTDLKLFENYWTRSLIKLIYSN